MRVALAQINPSLGDFEGNRRKILEFAEKALERKCDLVVFPEACLFGYHPFDLLERTELVDLQLKEFRLLEKSFPKGIAGVVGLFTKNTSKNGRPFYNSAAFVSAGKKSQFFNKELLPTGDVFDEARFIQAGKLEKNFFSYKGKKIFVTICEDIWAWPNAQKKSTYSENPLTKVKGKKVDLVVNLSASPFYEGKHEVRKKLVQNTAKYFKAPMVYVNMVGAQDEIIFDGGSFAVDKSGKEVSRCLRFQEDINVVDFKSGAGGFRTEPEAEAEIYRQALVLGIQDYCKKVGIEKVHLGLSGGVDSALVACLAVDALGPSRVVGLRLSGPFTSDDSLKLASQLAKNLGIKVIDVSITESYELMKKTLADSLGVGEFSVVHENLQARLRGMLLMAYANQNNSLLLGTTNKSEMAAGYGTLYGDLIGGLMPIGDLTKTQVWKISKHYNHQHEVIPQLIIDRPPTAELRANQNAPESLPPYADLDQSVVRLIEMSAPAKSKTDHWLLSKLSKSEFKRWQAPPILKVSRHSFGKGRRLPVAHLSKF